MCAFCVENVKAKRSFCIDLAKFMLFLADFGAISPRLLFIAERLFARQTGALMQDFSYIISCTTTKILIKKER